MGCVWAYLEQSGFIWTWRCGELWHQSEQWGFGEQTCAPVRIVGDRQEGKLL